MNLPVQVTFRGMAPSAALEEYVRLRADKLGRLSTDARRCRVVVEASQRHAHGWPFHVTIELAVTGQELVVKRDPGAAQSTDARATIDAAFEDAARRLAEHAGRRRDVRHGA